MKAVGVLALGIAAASMIAPAMARAQAPPPPSADRPNILILYSDDVGWGDLSCYGSTKTSTPNLDRLAAGGVRFTDAHAVAATCTPSRYSLLTGEYAFRKKGAQILSGDANMLIQPGSATLPQTLKERGYETACIGKWHLGLGQGKIDWNGQINPGPLEIGFDESFIIPATPDRVPCVYVDGHTVEHLDPDDPLQVSSSHKVGDEPTGKDHPELLRYPGDPDHSGTIVDHISRMGWMSGGHAAWWTDEMMAEELTQRAENFLERNTQRPFFLYFAINDIHVPRAPNPQFVGTSKCGLRGDQVEELDYCVGQIMSKLDALHLTDHTLVVFSSDNGPILFDGYKDGTLKDLNGHTPAGPYRGGKYQIFEGGTRVPMITYWPGHIQPGVSDALVCQMDYLASFARLSGAPLAPDARPDSMDVLPALLGQTKSGRDQLVEEAGSTLAIRKGNWKYIPPGLRSPFRTLEEGDKTAGPPLSPSAQLYDLSTDPGEKHNVAVDHPDICAQLDALLKANRKPLEK